MSPAGSGAINLPDQVVSRGDDVNLVCSAGGGPDNVYRWLFTAEDELCEECIINITGKPHRLSLAKWIR